MDEKKYIEANETYTKKLAEYGYYANKGSFYPAFDLHAIYETNSVFENYKRILDLKEGVCTIEYSEDGKKAKRTAFASIKDGVIVLHIEKESPFGVSLALELHDSIDMLDYAGNPFKFNGKYNSISFDKYIYSEVKVEGGVSYSGIVKILDTDGEITSNCHDKSLNIDMTGCEVMQNYVKIANATHISLIIDIENSILGKEKFVRKIDKIQSDYEIILKRHASNFKKLFLKTTIDICGSKTNETNEKLLLDSYNGKVDLRLIEKMADYGRYLLISSSYKCKYPANLQGVWNGYYDPAWGSAFFNNENIQMEYWQALAGNLKETLLPLFNLYETFIDDYKENAKKFYGCRGILLPLFMDNQSGKKDNLQPHVIYWTGSSAWVASIYYDYYLYTCDEEFLLKRAYPFMKEAALFYEDFFVIDEYGKLKLYPANSPENRADGNFYGAKELSVSINPTMDFALLKELLTSLVDVSKIHNIDAEKRQKWEDMLSRIPQYAINEDGAICEWIHEDFKDNYHHRHQSHIYPLFPGREITKEYGGEIYNALKVAVEKRLCIGIREQTGWSFAHMANIFARLGEGECAKDCLNNIIRFCTGVNLFTHHNDWRNMGVTLKFLWARKAPFQIDANMGFTAAVYEMLAYSNSQIIKLLPALPAEWNKGKVKGLCARGGFVLDFAWDEKVCSVSIISQKTSTVKLSVIGYDCKDTDENRFVKLSFKANERKTLLFEKQ